MIFRQFRKLRPRVFKSRTNRTAESKSLGFSCQSLGFSCMCTLKTPQIGASNDFEHLNRVPAGAPAGPMCATVAKSDPLGARYCVGVSQNMHPRVPDFRVELRPPRRAVLCDPYADLSPQRSGFCDSFEDCATRSSCWNPI